MLLAESTRLLSLLKASRFQSRKPLGLFQGLVSFALDILLTRSSLSELSGQALFQSKTNLQQLLRGYYLTNQLKVDLRSNPFDHTK